MYVLVLYQDEIWHVCPLKNVSTVRKKCMVKYSDNKKYAARVMAICHDKMILTGIMKNIHGTTNHMQGVWELENIPSKSFSQVSKDFSKDVKEHVLFIDENLFKKSLSDNLIQCFNFDQDINIYKFVLKQPRFKRIKRVNEENTSQESMLKSMAKNLSDDEISPTSADKCSPSKIIRNDDDKIQESMSKSMAKDFPDDEIPPISANECSPPKVTVNDENTSQESMLKSMAKNLSDDEILPTSADKCSPSKIIINDDDTIQESMSKSMTKDAPDDEIPLISADEYSPSKVKSLDAPSDFSKFSPSNLHTEQKNRCIEEPKMLAKTNIIQSNIVEDESLSVTIDKSLQLNPPILEAASNFLILQAIGNPTFNSTLKEGCNPVVICLSDAEQKENSIRYLNIPEKLCIVDPSIDHGTNLLSAISGPRPSEFLISHDSPELQATGQLILINNVQEGLSLLNLSHSDVQQKCQGQLESKFSIDQSSTEEKIFVNLSEISHKQTIESSGYDKTYTVHESDNPKNCNELHQIFNGTLQNTIQGSFIELTEEPINHSLLDLNLEISQLSQVLKLNNGISKFSLINNEVNLPKYHTLEQGIANSHGINGQTIARITEKTTISENIEPEKDNSKEKIKPKIVSEEKVCIKLPKKRKYDDTNSGLQNLETKMKRRKQKKEIEREAKENEEKEPEEEDKAARGVESYFGESGDDEDEYKPDSNEESSESEYDENHEFQDDDELDADLRTEQTFSDSLNDTITVDQNSKASAPDDRELLVDPTSRTAKKHFCLFCKKFQAKIARHLQLKHHDQEEVKKFMALPVRSQERQQIISVIRKNGDHVYNSDRQFNSGKLIVCRRPAACREKKAEDFIACGNCKGQYSRLVIRHHWRKCTKQNSKGQRIVLVKGKKVSARLHERANADVRKHIFPYLREDEVVRSIRYDELLIVFANKQCEQYGTNQHLYQMVRSRLRLLGRLLVAIKSLNSHITSFTHIFQPRHYDFLIEAVKKVAVFLPETKTFLHPAVGSTIGTLLKKVGEILRSEYIKKEEKENQKKVEDFLKLLEEDYGTSINRIVTETQTQHFRTKEVVLPSTNDIQKLYKYLVDERNKYFQELQVKFSFKSWKKLSEMTLLSLLVFNRRRPGEIERLFVKNFQSCRGINDMADREIYETLAPEGKALAKRYKRFEIRGKRNRTVAVLVDEDLKECMDLVFKYRKDAQVSRKNEYFFGMPSLDKDRHRSLGACYLLRQHAAKCGADFPCHLRGTKLRKHVATRCINLNLEGNQVTDLANFMGHHEDIHKKIYRQPVAATDIVKMSKILQMVQGVNDSSDDSSDDEAEPSTSRVTMSEPNVSQSDSVYGPDTSRFSVQSRINQSSLKFDNSAPKTWTDEAKSTVLSAFKRHLENGNVPSGKEMQELINTHDCFKGRSVPQMRSWLHTYKKKMNN